MNFKAFLSLFIGLCLVGASLQFDSSVCSCRRNAKARIVGGRLLGNGESGIPWLASLGTNPSNPLDNIIEYVRDGRNRLLAEPVVKIGVHRCGAVILNSEWILTSAHCAFKHPNKYTLGVGKNQDLIEMYNSGRLLFKERHMHPLYNSTDDDNQHFYDAALLRLETPLQLDGAELSPACLKLSQDWTPDSQLLIYGWGANTQTYRAGKFWETGPNSQTLKELRLVDNSDSDELCADRSDIFCAKAAENSWTDAPCTGDDGSPVHQLTEGKMLVVGLQSYSLIKKVNTVETRCAGTMAITRIGAIETWLREMLNDEFCAV